MDTIREPIDFMAKNNVAAGSPKPGDKKALDLALKDLAEKRRTNNIALVSIGVTFVIAVVSLVWNSVIQKQATHTSEVLETTRVENDDVVTNTNNFAHPWAPWIDTVSPITIHLGVGRDVAFARSFRKPPHITLALRGLDFPDMATVLTKLGFSPKGAELERIHHIHITSEVSNVTANSFKLLVGIGLPTEAAKFLQRHLQSSEAVDRDIVADMRTARMLENHDKLTSDEIWMTNFYTTVGTFQVTWVAQAEEDLPKH